MPLPILSRPLKTTCVVLQVVPLPGVGAIIAGWRNPHTGLLGRGISQLALVLFGSWPLIIPGAIGLVWAAFDAVRISKAKEPPPWSQPAVGAEEDPRAMRKAARQEARQARREARAARKAREADAPDDDTRWMP